MKNTKEITGAYGESKEGGGGRKPPPPPLISHTPPFISLVVSLFCKKTQENIFGILINKGELFLREGLFLVNSSDMKITRHSARAPQSGQLVIVLKVLIFIKSCVLLRGIFRAPQI